MAVIDTTRDSLTIVTVFQYRGGDEEYSNTFFMSGATPASPSSWKTLADAVIADQAAVIPADQSIVRAIGHVAGQSVAVWDYDYAAASEEVAGTRPIGTEVACPGDSAVWVRWSTDQKTSYGKPIYLRSYFHPGYYDAGPPDITAASLVTALEEYATDWVAGFTDGDGVLHTRAGPHGVAGLAPVVGSPNITTRTLERRGKRPPA